MFIIEAHPNREMKVLLRGIKQKFGYFPPHWELFASLNPKRFIMFMNEINYLTTHPNIHRDFFAFVRYAVAMDNDFEYCIKFNHDFLEAQGYSTDEIGQVEDKAKLLPMDNKHQRLFEGVMQAIYNPKSFDHESIVTLQSAGWSDADIFDAVDHGAFLFRFAKVLKAYLK